MRIGFVLCSGYWDGYRFESDDYPRKFDLAFRNLSPVMEHAREKKNWVLFWEEFDKAVSEFKERATNEDWLEREGYNEEDVV